MKSDINFPDLDDLYLWYHKNTELTRHFGRGFDWIPNFDPAEMAKRAATPKQFPARHQIHLTPDGLGDLSEQSFHDVLMKRRSRRQFSDDQVSFSTVSTLINLAAGITGNELMYGNISAPLRSFPSAGGLVSSQLWVAPRRVSGLQPNIFHYDAITESLSTAGIPLSEKDMSGFLDVQKCNPAAVFVISSRFDVLIEKYGQRGYRYAFLDAGHLGQNLYLVGTALGLGVYSSCGFIDAEVNKLLHLDGKTEAVTYVLYMGMPIQP